MEPLRYLPYHQLDGAPNIVVDGSPTTGTVLTLSHWPNSTCPPGVEADLSAEMAINYLERPEVQRPADAVTNNHFDQDGLVSVFALAAPEQCLARRHQLIDLASAGDFATYRDRRAARASMVIAAYADPERSPIGSLASDYMAATAALYEELLPRVPELCDEPDRYRDLWRDEDACLEASEELVRRGRVHIEEVPQLDLAVVEVPVDAPDGGGHRFGGEWVTGLHPMAINNATHRFAVLVARGGRLEFSYRYETWVQYRSRRPRPRVDLGPLAEELTAAEPSGSSWVWEGAGALTPRLYLRGSEASAIVLGDFRRRLESFLEHAPPAWDPYADRQPTPAPS
jgi:uncharacterized protein DUF6687